MAKTYKDLYRAICEFDNIHRAYIKARRLKRYKADVLTFSSRLEENLIDIHNHLVWKTYQPGRYHYFMIYEPKERLIAALPFRDRVVHHALCNIIEPIFERSFIHDSYACRVGKGSVAGVNRTTRFLRAARQKWGRVYCLKLDVKKFFPNIDHYCLKRIVRKFIACPDTLWLIDLIIDSEETDRGIPIGSLTSQLFANLYLNELDHLIKDRWRVKFYIRYMDDCIVIHYDKTYLHALRKDIEGFLEENLRLTLNGKTQVFPVKSRGIDFLGYRIWPDYRLLRPANVKRTKRKLRKFGLLYSQGMIPLTKITSTIQSWIGHCKHADTYRLREKVTGNLRISR